MKKFSFIVALVALVTVGSIFTSCTKDDEGENAPAKTVVLSDPQAVVGQWQVVADWSCCGNGVTDTAMYCNGNGHHWGNGDGECNGEGHHWGNGECNGEGCDTNCHHGDGNCDGNGHHWGNGECDGEGCDTNCHHGDGNCDGNGHHYGDGNCDGNGHCGEGCNSNAVRNQFVGSIWDIVTDGTIVMNNMINGAATTVENGNWTVDNDCLVIGTRRFVVKKLTETCMVLSEELADGTHYNYRFVKE